MIHTHCQQCGDPLPPPRTPGPPRRYCPRPKRCKDHHWNRIRPRKPRAAACLQCGTPLPKPRPGAPRLFCSKRCTNLAARDRERSAKIQRYCDDCGTPLPRLARRDQRYCHDRCRKRHRQELLRKPKPPSPRETLVMQVGWPGAEVKRAA